MLTTIPSGVVIIIVYGIVLTRIVSESSDILELYRTKRQSQDADNAGCKLPPPQQNGKFSPSKRRCPPDDTSHPLCQMTPGNLVPHNWPLFHSCDPGYALNATNPVSVCLDGQWRPALPGCVRLCPPQDWMRWGLTCVYRGREVSCDGDARPGTVASAECAQFYRSNIEMTCQDDGNWAKLNRSSHIETQMVPNRNTLSDPYWVPCVPECGLTSKVKNAGENTTNISDYPWMAGVYHKDKDLGNRYFIFCVGSLITSKFVITVASCLENHKPEDLRVGLGKVYQDFYQVEDSSFVHEVDKILVYDSHNGSTTANGTDVALLRLLLEAQVSASIMPICVDWNHIYPLPNDFKLENKEPTRKEIKWKDPIVFSKVKYMGILNCTINLRQLTNGSLAENNSCGEILFEGFFFIDGSGISVTYEKEGRLFLLEYQSYVSIEDEVNSISSIDLPVKGLSKWLEENIMNNSFRS